MRRSKHSKNIFLRKNLQFFTRIKIYQQIRDYSSKKLPKKLTMSIQIDCENLQDNEIKLKFQELMIENFHTEFMTRSCSTQVKCR